MYIIYHHRTQRKLVEGVHISNIINGLIAKGHGVFEIALINSKKQERSSLNTNKKKSPAAWFFGWFSKHLPNKVFRILEVFYNIWAIFALNKAVRKKRPDFIYERYSYFNFAGVFIGWLYKIPVVLEVNITTSMDDKRKLELIKIARYIENKILIQADVIFVVSDYLKEYMVSTGINGTKIFVQPNAFSKNVLPQINESNMLRKLRQKNDQLTIIGFVGGLGQWYHLPELIKVFKNLHEQHSDIHLVFIGDGSERGGLEKMTMEYQLGKNISFVGRVSQVEALGYLSEIDIGVIPSTNLWGSPMKLFEYMGMGKPVVAPDIKVISTIASDGIHGKLFEHDNFNELEAALKLLIEDVELRNKMGHCAKEHILKNHTWNCVVDNILEVVQGRLKRLKEN